MNIGWPAMWIAIVALAVLGMIAISVISGRSEVAKEEAKGKYGEQYRMLAADYEKLAKEMRDVTSAIQTGLRATRERVDSIERMMKEVG
jgi:flagellar biosynthesis/type III secretory pathway M-ring protein FliF/YscJ